jgi:glutamate-ammonia-ligase adenylyltransferase
MTMERSRPTLTELARLGFADLASASERLQGLDALAPLFAHAPDADLALAQLLRLRAHVPELASAILADADAAERLIRILGASEGLGDFLVRRPEELAVFTEGPRPPATASEYVDDLLDAIRGLEGEPGRIALRVRYRRNLVRIASWDLESENAMAVVGRVGEALADLAGAALDASLELARRDVSYPPDQVAATRLAIIGMGKAGARELNYLSDVDVIFAVDGGDALSTDRATEIGTRLAMGTMRGIHELAAEPALWEVDANLRPEGKNGALVRTIESHVAYYDRWAKNWEFQALLKARPLAGDRELGERYVAAIRPKVWSSSTRDGFVESVQRMRERVTAHIPADLVDVQLKLGPGGLRDVEFTIQLLQLVHGHMDERVRDRGTLTALVSLADSGYIGRIEAAEFSRDYRFLRVLEHRLQLARLQRTHLMPTDEDALRVLARSSGLAANGAELVMRWQRTKQSVRQLHERLFYRPLLSAVAALPDEGFALTSEQAAARLAAIGFRDPAGALRHISALTGGVSRRAAIQRTLLPVMLQWLADGADPDYGLLAFRRLSDQLGEAYWFLRMLRDSSGAARRLTHVLSGSRFVDELIEVIPEAAAWLGNDEELHARPLTVLLDEARATVARHADDTAAAAVALRTARRREVLRLAMAAITGTITVQELGVGLSSVTTALLTGALAIAHRFGDGIEFAIVAMGRYGGEELGFGSDADIVYVYAPAGLEEGDSQRTAEHIVREIARLTEDLRLPLDLDLGLRPEGRNGAVVRSLQSYRAYYARWSLTWEAQALLRARVVAGDAALSAAFTELADEVRYPVAISDAEVREVRRIKARVESERLPQAADPSRHLKLGRGSLSDVEWFVQLLQLQHAARIPGLRTTSTLRALQVAEESGLVRPGDAARLREAWILASRARSAMTLWTAKTADVLPTERRQLEGVARLLEYPPGSASVLEEDYLRTTRHARQVFEREFYG